MQKLAKQQHPNPRPGAATPPASIPAKPGKPAAESPAPANTDDTPEEAQMPATPITPENVLTRFDKLLIEFEKQRADAADRERDAAARQAKRDQAMLERIAALDTRIEQQGKEMIKHMTIVTGTIVGLGFIIFGIFIDLRIDNTAAAPIVIYASQPPAIEQPAPAPSPTQPAN